jgi:uncharacterized damage-inducible protein DinB
MTHTALAALVEINTELIQQLITVLEGLDDLTYRRPHPALAPQRVGPHVRHILEFYECFLSGVGAGAIDYDARARDEAVEHSREVAVRRLRTAAGLLHRLPGRCEDFPLRVRMEDAPDGLETAWLESSVARELQVLASHSTHHYALIAMLLQMHGRAPGPRFGVARSTLRYRGGTSLCAQ